jgi:KpsF/GutQ family protein
MADMTVKTLKSDVSDDPILARGRAVVQMEARGLESLASVLDHHFVAAVEALRDLEGRAIVSGLGKSGHVARKIAATLASTGTPAFFVHSAEAAHGDMGMISPRDVVVLLSNSGETAELLPVIEHAKRLGIPMIGISSRTESTLIRCADIPLVLPNAAEACPIGVAPTTSTTMMLALGDALAMAVMQERGFTHDDFRLLHPGGSIGLRLTKVSQFMHKGERLPLVAPDMPMSEVVMEMTSKSFGIAGVVDATGALVGVITDGDLRRHMNELTSALAGAVMSRSPRVIDAGMLAGDALRYLNDQKVTALFVVDTETAPTTPIGLVTFHDFIQMGLK